MIHKFDFLLEKIYLKLDKIINQNFFDYPFGRNPLANKKRYLSIANKAKKVKYPLISKFEKDLGYSVDKKWFHQLALHTQVVIKKSDICYQHGRLLYSSLRKYINQNKFKYINILETGTARGFSSLCMAKALFDHKIEGKILTFDVLPHKQKMYWNIIDDNDSAKTRAELLDKYQPLVDRYLVYIQGRTQVYLDHVTMPRIHFAFLDAQHDYPSVMEEFNLVKESQKKGDIIFFDDYTPHLFPGVKQAVDEICDKFNYRKKIIKANKDRVYVLAKKR